MKISKVFVNTGIYSIGTIIPKVIGFVFLPIYTIYLTPTDYGIINSVQVLQPLFALLFSLGLDSSIFRLYCDYKSQEEKRTFFSTIFIFTFLLSSFCTLILIIFNSQVEQIYKSIDFFPFFLYSIITTFVANLFVLPRKYMMLMEQANKFVFWSLMQFVITAVITLFFVISLKSGAEGFLEAKMIGTLALAPVFLFFSFRIINFKFSFAILRQILKFSLPILPVLLSSKVVDFSDRVFLERYLSVADVGIYSIAYTIASISILLSSSLDIAYRPTFFRNANMEDIEHGKKEIYKFNNIILVINALLFFTISLFSKEVVILFLNERYHDSYLYIPIILASNFFVSASAITARFFEQSKKTKQNMYIYFFIALFNILLNYLLIPLYGIYGAALATIISFFACFTITYLYAKKNCFFIPINFKLIVPGLLITASIIIIQYFYDINIIFSLVIKLFIIAVLAYIVYKKYSKTILAIFFKNE